MSIRRCQVAFSVPVLVALLIAPAAARPKKGTTTTTTTVPTGGTAPRTPTNLRITATTANRRHAHSGERLHRGAVVVRLRPAAFDHLGVPGARA